MWRQGAGDEGAARAAAECKGSCRAARCAGPPPPYGNVLHCLCSMQRCRRKSGRAWRCCARSGYPPHASWCVPWGRVMAAGRQAGRGAPPCDRPRRSPRLPSPSPPTPGPPHARPAAGGPSPRAALVLLRPLPVHLAPTLLPHRQRAAQHRHAGRAGPGDYGPPLHHPGARATAGHRGSRRAAGTGRRRRPPCRARWGGALGRHQRMSACPRSIPAPPPHTPPPHACALWGPSAALEGPAVQADPRNVG